MYYEKDTYFDDKGNVILTSERKDGKRIVSSHDKKTGSGSIWTFDGSNTSTTIKYSIS